MNTYRATDTECRECTLPVSPYVGDIEQTDETLCESCASVHIADEVFKVIVPSKEVEFQAEIMKQADC